jgi:hypothetical protein
MAQIENVSPPNAKSGREPSSPRPLQRTSLSANVSFVRIRLSTPACTDRTARTERTSHPAIAGSTPHQRVPASSSLALSALRARSLRSARSSGSLRRTRSRRGARCRRRTRSARRGGSSRGRSPTSRSLQLRGELRVLLRRELLLAERALLEHLVVDDGQLFAAFRAVDGRPCGRWSKAHVEPLSLRVGRNPRFPPNDALICWDPQRPSSKGASFATNPAGRAGARLALPTSAHPTSGGSAAFRKHSATRLSRTAHR